MFGCPKIVKIPIKGNKKKQNRRLKILYLQLALGVGGAEELRLTVLKYINKEKYDIRLCCLVEKGEIGKEIEKLGFRVDVIGTSERLSNILSFFPIFAYLKQNKFDVVQTSLPTPNLYGRVAALFTRVPYIIAEEHSYYERYNRYLGYLFRMINKVLVRHTHRIISCSDAVKQRVAKEEKVSEDHFLTIHNAIDTKKFVANCSKKESRIKLGLNPDMPVIGFIASLAPRKGHIYLFQAMRLTLYSYPELKLLIVGEGPLRRKLEVFVQQSHLGNSVEFMGSRRDIPQLLKAMDIFVSPAIKEAFGINLIEAMYSEVPCIATNVGGIPEVVRDGVTGILVPQADPQALARAIKELLDKPELAKKYGEAGRRRVLENFTADKYIEKLENLYDGLTIDRN